MAIRLAVFLVLYRLFTVYLPFIYRSKTSAFIFILLIIPHVFLARVPYLVILAHPCFLIQYVAFHHSDPVSQDTMEEQLHSVLFRS